MKVIGTPEAEQDREAIWDYIARDNPPAATWMDMLFSEAVVQLVDHPQLGKQGSIPKTRELIPHESYRLIYGINSETIWILAWVHTARRWPSIHG